MVVATLTRIMETNNGMHVNTILNRLQKQRGFVYGTVQFEERIGREYGFRSYPCLEIALYDTLGQLPEPEATHRFC